MRILISRGEGMTKLAADLLFSYSVDALHQPNEFRSNCLLTKNAECKIKKLKHLPPLYSPLP